MRYSQAAHRAAGKLQPNRGVIRVTCSDVMGGLTGFSVAGGGSMSAVSEVGWREVGKRSWHGTSGREASERGGDECMSFGLGAAGIPMGP